MLSSGRMYEVKNCLTCMYKGSHRTDEDSSIKNCDGQLHINMIT